MSRKQVDDDDSISPESKEIEAPRTEVIHLEDEKDAKKKMLKHLWEDWLDDFKITSQGIQVVIINDAQGILVPALDFTIFGMACTMLKTPTVLQMVGQVSLGLQYFNPLPSKMEPVLEKFGLDFEVTMQENPQMAVILKSTETMNINVSDSMLKTIYGTTLTWTDDYKNTLKEIEEKKE